MLRTHRFWAQAQVLKHLLMGNSMKPFNHISVLFSEPLEASLRFLTPEVLNPTTGVRAVGKAGPGNGPVHVAEAPAVDGESRGV